MVLAAVVPRGKLFVRFGVHLGVVEDILHDSFCENAIVATTADDKLAFRKLVKHHQGLLLLRLLIVI